MRKIFSKLRTEDGKQSNATDPARKKKTHEGSAPRAIFIPNGSECGMPSLRKTKTSGDLLHTRRAVSPNTLSRMRKVLRIDPPSTAISAPTALILDKSMSSVKSEPTLTAGHGIPTITDSKSFRKLQKKANFSRRKSMISRVQREPTTQTSSRSLNRLKGIRRFKQSSDILNSEASAGMSTCQSLHTAQLVSVRKSIDIKENVKIPKGKVSIVITDIQGSTRMWEQNAPAMKDALDIHDAIIRKCYAKQSGYEITTEGDSFQLAFHHPLDALSFCLDCQQCLYNADWSDDILELSNAKFIEEQLVRGLRVRMGVHCGPSTSEIHEVTRRIYYNGEALELAKSMERASHGGQIITNVETWREVSGMAERYLGKPQVMDLGVHELKGKGETIYTRSLVQLVPKEYAFDYCTFRGTALNQNDQRPEGRTFPPPKTAAQTCAAFFDAPYLNNKVTMIFVNTTLVEEAINEQDIPKYSKNLAKIIRGLLIRTNPPGYECQEDNGNWMLAFHSLETAILFGLNLVARIKIARFPLLSKIGVQSGTFTSMGPHAITGRADYFGPIVNRAARVTASAEKNEVRLGIPKDELVNFIPPQIEDVKVTYVGTKLFKGVNVETALFSCVPFVTKKKWNDKSHRRMSLISDISAHIDR